MKLTVIGARGQLGSELAAALEPLGQLELLGHEDIEIGDVAAIEARVAASKPDVVFNCAAFHKTDLCEVRPGRGVSAEYDCRAGHRRVVRTARCHLRALQFGLRLRWSQG